MPDSNEGPHSFLRSPDGTYKDIGALTTENPMTNAYALNNRNHITGSTAPLTFPDQALRAFIWSRGVMRDLGDFGTEPNAGLAINDCGQITGYLSVTTGFRDELAFIYKNGRLIDIDGRPASVGERDSVGEGINNHSHVVGSSNHLSGFIYRGRKMESLNALIDPSQGWDIAFPRAINDAGQIAAIGYRKGVQYAVRLDLIRPLALQAPALELDKEAAPPANQAERDAQAGEDAAAQAKETVQTVRQ